jgi:hypothetical protein
MGTLRTQRRSAIGASTPLERGYPHGGEAGYHAAGVPSTSEASERVMGQSHDVGAGKLPDALGVAAAQHCEHEWVSTSSTAGDSPAIRLLRRTVRRLVEREGQVLRWIARRDRRVPPPPPPRGAPAP